jgi:hypothetical protein
MTGGSTGGGFTGGGSTGGGVGGGAAGGTGVGLGTGGGGSSGGFLDTGLGTSGGGAFLTSGYEPGSIGQAAKAGIKTTTSSDIFARYYVNPMAIGRVTPGTNTAITPFGTPLYTSLYPGTQITSPFSTTNVTGLTRVTPVGTTSPFGSFGGPGGFGTTGYRAPAGYTTSIGFKYQPPTPSKLLTDVQGVLARSSDLPKTLGVALDGQTVVLRGQVADADQRRLAENLVKLTPGVQAVRNEVLVREENVPASKPAQ